MSNVLIGIIGVILFIGLALAGALILGDDFTTATSSSEAAATVSQLQQTQAAIEMWRLKTGQRRVVTQNTAFLVPRFLKTPAVNPTSWGRSQSNTYWRSVMLNNDVDTNPDDEGRAYTAGWAMIIVGPQNDAKARATCLAIEEGQGRTTIGSARQPHFPIGCNLPADAAHTNYHYVAYAYFTG